MCFAPVFFGVAIIVDGMRVREKMIIVEKLPVLVSDGPHRS
jgi:hypothetical protein